MILDKRKKYYLIIDTEGRNAIYELGLVVCDKKGKEYLVRDYILNNNINNIYNFKSDYKYKKLFQINQNIKNKKAIVLYNDDELTKRLKKIIDFFNIQEIYCYNTKHDKILLNEYIKRDIKWFDIWSIACQILGKQKLFRIEAERTTKNNYKTNVESFYKYITQTDYKQSHDALEDAKQEKEILIRCLKTHTSINKNINSNCWKI